MEPIIIMYSYTMQHPKSYLTPATRVGRMSLERSFLATATIGNVTPGEDPGTGGSWDFGDND